MNFAPPVFIASRFLFGRKKSGRGSSGLGGAILGIGISLVPLLLALLVSDGMIQGITKRYMETKSYHLQIALPAGFVLGQAAPGLSALTSMKEVKAAYLEKNGSAIIVSAKTSRATVVRAISPGYYTDSGTTSYLRCLAGELAPANNHSIVLGSSLATLLGVSLGDQVTIVTSGLIREEGSTGLDASPAFSPRLAFFRVTGIVSAGYRELDALWSFVSFEAADRALQTSNSYEFVGVKVSKPFSNSLGSMKLQIASAFGALYPEWFEPRLVRSWTEIEASLYRSFSTTKSMLLYIMGIALLVAAVNLGTALATFATERKMEIAILRSMGADDRLIRRIFLGAGLLTGASGTLLGICFGLFLSSGINEIITAAEWLANSIGYLLALISGHYYHVIKLLDPGYYLEKIPISPDYAQIAAIGALSVTLCVVASILPAIKATRVSVQTLVRKT